METKDIHRVSYVLALIPFYFLPTPPFDGVQQIIAWIMNYGISVVVTVVVLATAIVIAGGKID